MRQIFWLLMMVMMPALSWGLEKVSLQLQWLNQFQFAGFYIAKERGFYEARGLDVEIREHQKGMHTFDEVISARSTYGVGHSSLLLEYAKHPEIVALGAVFQSAPSVLITTDPAIKTLNDLKGKRIMITQDQANAASIMSMLFSRGLQLKDLILQAHSYDINDLIVGNTDAMACYLSNEVYTLNAQHITHHVFDPKAYGFNFFGDMIFTSRHEIQSYPERTRAFYEASMQGWQWAFEHIEETAQIIFEKYNTQNKSLKHLIFEGRVLESLAYDDYGTLGTLDKKRLQKIADVYHLLGLNDLAPDIDAFADPLGFNKQELKFGILAKRGSETTLKRWIPLQRYLNAALEHHYVSIVPIDFNNMYETIEKRDVDFLLTNNINYVEMENTLGITRIATLKNRSPDGEHAYSHFGGVIFTKRGAHEATLRAIKGSRFAAVDAHSFGGWAMAYELLVEHGIEKEDLKLQFVGTHDAVVEAVLRGDADYGTVRTDTLERMHKEGVIDLNMIEIVNPKTYKGFGYLVSTKLYPEWPVAQLPHISHELGAVLVSALIKMPFNSQAAIDSKIGGWTVPLDYSGVHEMLKTLKLAPYDSNVFTLKSLYETYRFWIYAAVTLLLVLVVRFVHVAVLNHQLDVTVKAKTKALREANEHLKELAHTDALTGIYNRGYFLSLAEHDFEMAKRHKTPLQVLSLDIDHFKEVNDTYGHQIGDEVLVLFAQSIMKLLRRSDTFGRFGGEEFVVCLQNTSHEGALSFAQRILEEIRAAHYVSESGEAIRFTVSIGLATLGEEKHFKTLLAHSDKALYAAKKEGRDRVVEYDQTL